MTITHQTLPDTDSNSSDFISVIAGTRPNFMKVAPILRALTKRGVGARLIHTGQHFDPTMSDVFFHDLGMPSPHVMLHAGGGSHAQQTASVLVGAEAEFMRSRPWLVLVVGDVTSTLASALAASKIGIPVVHVEAGLRSRDWTMPEEINRVLTDRLSDLLLTPSLDAHENLRVEGISSERVVFIGNVMIDSLHYALQRPTDILTRLGLLPKSFAVVTLHRPANVDTPEALANTLDVLAALATRVRVVLPIHPRTRGRLAAFKMDARLFGMENVNVIDPLGYNDFISLFGQGLLVATDSGGIQEETTALGIPCLTLRDTTERPITVTQGTNVLVGMDPARVGEETDRIVRGHAKHGTVPEGWDGRAAERAIDALLRFMAGTPAPLSARANPILPQEA